MRRVFFSLLLFFIIRPAEAASIRFKTSDGVTISADFRPPAKLKPVFVLLHGLGSGRGEWEPFISSLAARGYGSLSLDARGHGRSDGPPYTTFQTTEAWMRLERDMEAALRYLERLGYPPERVVFGGASIGANLALRAAVKNSRVLCVLLFSPGMDYHGVTIESQLRSLDKPLLLAAAQDDPYSMQSCLYLAPQMRRAESRFLYAHSGHGVRMLEGPDNQIFVRELFGWIESRVRAAWPSKNSTSP